MVKMVLGQNPEIQNVYFLACAWGYLATIYFHTKSDTIMLSQKLCPVHLGHILPNSQISNDNKLM
jgi:hypothetical protein